MSDHANIVAMRTAIDQLVYARQREWHGIFGHDKLKLRELIYETVEPYICTNTTNAKLRDEVERLRWVVESYPGFSPNPKEYQRWNDARLEALDEALKDPTDG